MQRRYNPTYFVFALGLALSMIGVDAQAQLAFASNREGNFEIYVMNANGKNPQNLTGKFFDQDVTPAWFRPPLGVASAGKKFTMWGWLKQVVR